MFCDAGAGPPVDCVNDSDVGETVSVFDETMFSVTGNVCGLLATLPEVAVTVTVPLYVPTPTPAGFAATCRLVGVASLVGEISSQFDPLLVLEATLKLTAEPSVVVTATGTKGDVPEPTVAENVAIFGLITRSAELLTTSVTPIV